MNVLLIALGSHGDVHPFVGLSLALRARGHRVRVAANPHFAGLLEQVGLDLIPIGTAQEYRDLATNPALWSRFQGTCIVLRSLGRTIRPVYEAVVRNAEDHDTVVVASSLALGARVAEEKLNIPTATVHLQPSIFLSAIRPPLLQGTYMPAWMPLWMRRTQLSLIDAVADELVAPPLNAFRQELGLPPVRRILSRYLNSPRRVIGLFPDWYAPPAPDWPAQTRLTGFPLYDESGLAQLSPELVRFLDSGDAPVAFTPGSAMWAAQRFFRESVRACHILGRRGLLLTRHLDHLPQDLPATVLHVNYAPFSALLPRCAALVHHGGIGTSAQALAAGVPQLVMPQAHDQPDNAARLGALGVARTIEPNRYKAARVARELAALIGSEKVHQRCREVAMRFADADPIARTCNLIEALRGPVPAIN